MNKEGGKMKIGIDVDGVILDYTPVIRAYAELYDLCELKKKGVINKKGSRLVKRYDWSEKEFLCFANRYFIKSSEEAPFNPLAIEIIKRLKEDGHELYIVSNRGAFQKEAITVVQKRFKKESLPIDKYFWGVENKTKVCLENNIDILIDDFFEICKDAVDNGIHALYFREKCSPKIEHHLLYDVDNWPQIYRHIKEIEKIKNNLD
jgi:hypothetical protein